MAVPIATGTERDDEARYLAGLRSRQLFVLAEKYCEDALAENPDPARATAIAVELSVTWLEHGKHRAPPERKQLWQRAQQLLDDWSARTNRPELKSRLTVQAAINLAHQATFLRWEWEARPHDPDRRAAATQRIGAAVRGLSSVAEQLPQDSALPAPVRGRLQEAVTLQLAQMQADLGRLEPPQSSARIEHFHNAEKLVKPLAASAITAETETAARLLYAECARERGDGPKALAVLDEALRQAETPAERSRIFAERIRTLLDDRRPDEATEQLIGWRREHGSLSGELHLLRMQALMDLWTVANSAGDQKTAGELLQHMNDSLQYARLEVGGYWTARCEELLNRVRETSSLGADVAAMKRDAEQAFAAGDHATAAGLLGAAADLATRKQRAEVAGSLYYQQGSVLIQQQQMGAAAAAFEKATATGSGSPQAHLMWAWCLGRLYKQQPTTARRLAYTNALAEHRRRYATAPTFAEATFLLAALEEARLQNTRAIELYREIRPEHAERYEQAGAAIARCYVKILDRLQSLDRRDQFLKWWQKAVDDLASRVRSLPSPPRELTEAQAELAIHAAAIHLYRPEQFEPAADALLQRAISSLEKLPPEPSRAALLHTARRWHLLAAALAGRIDEAIADTAGLRSRPAAEIYATLRAIDQMSTVSAPSRVALAPVLLHVGRAALGRQQDLVPDQQAELTALMVGVCLDNGQRDEAMKLAETLLKREATAEQLATAAARLQAIPRRDTRQLARKLWLSVESRSQPGSEPWLNARLHVASCALAVGDLEQCRKLLHVTRLLYPQLGNPSLHSRFEALEKQAAGQ